MRKPLRLFLLLGKRLYKKISFLLILLLIPAAVLALGLAAKEDSGFVTVALAAENPADPIAKEILDGFLAEDSLVRFFYVETPEEGVTAVARGKADAAWILPDKMEEKIALFTRDQTKDTATVRVVEREESVFLRLAREKLTAALQGYSARALYLQFARDNIQHLDSLSDEELMAYYHNVALDQTFFVFDDAEGGAESAAQGYLTSPIQGLLGVVTVLGSLAAALYYLEDEKKGTFSAVPENRRGLVAFIFLLIAALNLSLISFLSIVLAGILPFSFRLLGATLLFSLCSAGFALVFCRLAPSLPALAALLPVMAVLMVVLCPVFFDFRAYLKFQLLLPPTYFVNASYDGKYFLWMLLYFLACLALAALLAKLKQIRIQGTKKVK